MFVAGSFISLCWKWTPFGVLWFTSATAPTVICIRPVAVDFEFTMSGSKPDSFQMRQINNSVETADLLLSSTSFLIFSYVSFTVVPPDWDRRHSSTGQEHRQSLSPHSGAQ